MFGLVEAADQEQTPDLEVPRMCGICTVAVRFERGSRCVERLRRPAQVARDERDLGLGDDASCAGHGLFRAEGTCRTSQEALRSNEIAELRHRDASKRERRRIVAERDPVQCAEGITRGERTRGRRDQRVHRNPATLVTPTVPYPVLIYLTTTNQYVVARGPDGLWGMYQWLDRAPRGRNETGLWWRRHDEYDKR
jgi:hypothetical protein